MRRFAIALAATAVSATAAAAATTVQQLDADGDNFASEEEVMAAYPDFDPTFWDDVDTNGDNRVSAEEMETSEAQAVFSRYEAAAQSAPPVTVETLDADGDGFVSQEEFYAFFPDADQALANDLDTNDDNRLSPEELNTADAQTIISQIAPAAQPATVTVEALDTDGDGFVSEAELTAAYPNIKWADVSEIDVNSDNRLGPEEMNTSEAQAKIAEFE